ncbi:MAG: rod shape-determining protein MreC [bacterium]|nr:rod shape-determining protein MreC [bacterium]
MFRRLRPYLFTLGIILVILYGTGTIRSVCATLTYPFKRMSVWTKYQCSSRLEAAWDGLCNGPQRQDDEEERERLITQKNEFERIATERGHLLEELQWRPNDFSHDILPAPIWSHGGGLGVWPQLTLGVGAVDGVTEGCAVVVPEGLVGRVISVESKTCTVLLLSDASCRIAAEIPGVSKGITCGMDGQDLGQEEQSSTLYYQAPLRLHFLRADDPIQPGQKVYTEGSGYQRNNTRTRSFPRGICIGTVISTKLVSDGLLQEALVAPAVNPALLHTVFILKTSSPIEATNHAQ